MCLDQKSIVAEYLNEFHNKQQNEPQGRLIFRGQANQVWNVASSAGRRLANEDRTKQNDYIRYHVNLIANARKNGYSKLEAGTKLSDLEILAEIQHLGGATCLTDFTTNFLVALWFASAPSNVLRKDEKTDKWITVFNEFADGKVVWLDLGEEKNFNNISYYNTFKEGDTIQHILAKPSQNLEFKGKLAPRFWLWEPTKLNNRIIKQDSVFLFSLSAFPKNSSSDGKTETEKLEIVKDERILYRYIIVDEGDKSKIRNELDWFFGINAETVFYDLTGYSNNANAVEVEVSEKLLSKKTCLDNAKECIKKEQYSIANSYLDDALACKRKIVSCKKDKDSCCSNDCIGELLYWKGYSLEGKKEIDEALLNYYQAANALKKYIKNDGFHISNKFKLCCESYRKQSILYYGKQDYKNAANADESLQLLYANNPNRQIELNGIDSILALLEVFIFTFDQMKYEEYIESIDRELFKMTNGEILLFYLETLGNFIFYREKLNLEATFNLIQTKCDEIISPKKSKRSVKNTKADIIGYFYWDYSDTSKWIEKVRKKVESDSTNKESMEYVIEHENEIILLAQKADEAQTRLYNWTFTGNDAVETNVDE